MLADQWGYTVTTDNPQAVDGLNAALNSYVRWRTDTMQHFDAAIAADPDFALAHAAKGILVTGLRKPEIFFAAQAELDAARKGRAPTTERERLYIAALEAALAGRITEAASYYELIARDHPHDLFALRLGQFELFWIGEVRWMRDISERAAPHWSADDPGYPAYLSIRSFGLEENGAYELAETYGRKAVEGDPTDLWGTHAVAHVLIMQGRLKDGIGWIMSLSDNWAGANHIVHHLWWHLALFYVETGDYPAALEVYDQRLRDLRSPLMQAIPDFYVDIQNDVALLQRLEWRGLDVGDRWQAIAELARARIGNHTSPFTSAHCALALAAAERKGDHRKMMEQMREFAARDTSGLGPRYAAAVLPAGEAALAHREEDHQKVLDIMMPARRNLWQMGGSHAQSDLFYQMLANSALKLERKDVLAVLMEELGAIGFEHVAERSSYADAAAMIA